MLKISRNEFVFVQNVAAFRNDTSTAIMLNDFN